MKTPRSLVFAAATLAGLAAGRAPAQTCGPYTLQFTTTGAGCDTSGSGLVPTLSAAYLPNPTIPTCPVKLTVDTGVVLNPFPVVTLALGPSNPALPLPFLPGCTLRTTLVDVILFMGQDAGGPTLHSYFFFVPADPALVGASAYGQAGFAVPGGIRISNGIRIEFV